MYKNILVPVAYEAGHDAKAELAAARKLVAPGGVVTLLHVMDPVPFFAVDYMPEGYRDELIGAIHADLQRQADTLQDGRVLVVEGDAAREILDWAQGNQVDCIVLATHRSDTSLYGSTAARVVRYAPCAVHLLR
ncbi:MAG TPA: universal stress protein [Paracoccus sp.]|nr:universal stress protein [Paracoccus sp. (in: a-proteobacteria)]